MRIVTESYLRAPFLLRIPPFMEPTDSNPAAAEERRTALKAKLNALDLAKTAQSILHHVQDAGVPVFVGHMSYCPCHLHVVWFQEGLNRYHQLFLKDVRGAVRIDVDTNCEFDGEGCDGKLTGVTPYNAAVELARFLGKDLVNA